MKAKVVVKRYITKFKPEKISDELNNALEEITHNDGCFGVCHAGRVSGAHLANHTNECAHLQLLLGNADIPEDYYWDLFRNRLVYKDNLNES